jgi:uncharacterized membrane protein YvbJ
MFCNKCRTELPKDSEFCIKCGNKLEQPIFEKERQTKISKIKRIVSKIYSNPLLNIFTIIIFIVVLIIAYNLVKGNIAKVDNKKTLINITEEIIELKEQSVFLGSSCSEKRKLKEYQSQLYKGYLVIALSSMMIIISLFGSTFLISKLIKLRKKQGV